MINLISSPRFLLSFRLLYLALAFMSWNCYTANNPLLFYFSCILALMGFIILFCRFLKGNLVSKTPLIGLLVLFLLSFIVSAVASMDYGITGNIQGFIWLSMEFLLLYAICPNTDEIRRRNEIRIFLLVYVVTTFCFALISVVMAGMQYSYVSDLGVYDGNVGGLYNGRLFGLYSDPNIGAVCGVVSVLCSIYLAFVAKKPYVKFFVVANTIIQLVYFGLAGSRTAILSIVASGLFLAAAVLLRNKDKLIEEKRMWQGALFLCSLPLLFVFMSFGVNYIFDVSTDSLKSVEPSSSAAEQIHDALPDEGATEPPKANNEEADGLDQSQSGEIEAGPTGFFARISSSDVSTGRFGVWTSALAIWQTAPLVGVSHRNILNYAAENLPDIYIVQPRTTVSTMHNVYLDVLVSQGLIGLAIIVIFTWLYIKRIRKGMHRALRGQFFYDYAIGSAVLIALFVSAMFYSELLYINTIGSVLFWSIAGYLISIGNE